MKNLTEEIKRSKKLMGITEALNLPKNNTPEKYAKKLISDLVVNIENPDQLNPEWIGYYDEYHNLVMDEKIKDGKFCISSEKIYEPMQRKYPEFNNYDKLIPIIRAAIESLYSKKIKPTIHNVSQLETYWYRQNKY